MDTSKRILFLFLAFLVAGLVFGFLFPDVWMCTEKKCVLRDQNGCEYVRCNECMVERAIFVTGVVNIYETCKGWDLQDTCSNDVKFEIDEGTCTMAFDVFKFA